MTTAHEELVARNKATTLTTWMKQSAWNPLTMDRSEGIYFWDADGKRYMDFASQLINVNIGHSHPHVIKAIQDQVAKVAYAYPGIATEPRARLGEMLREITPDHITKSFFTGSGAEAVENAMKMARLYTGRQKIVTRYRSYHGATFGAMTAGGDPRRLANEPGVPWIVRFHGPYAYRSPMYRDRTPEEGDRIVADTLEQTILFEGPENIAAILLEGYNGTSGIMQGGPVFWDRIQEICDTYDILLIIDEVMSGFGRTGEWFGFNHYPNLKPDLITTAKGLSSGYVPLGAVLVSEDIAAHFEQNTLWGGLTYSSHALACAAGVATLQVYHDENLIENARKMGKKLRKGLTDLAEAHDIIGEIRGEGLHQIIELVKDRETREPMSNWNSPPTEPMRLLASTLRDLGMSTFVKWNWIFCAPPLIITEEQLDEALGIIDQGLSQIDSYYKG